MEVLESHSGNYVSVPLLDCADGSLNLNNMFFGGGGAHNKISHQLIYIIVELHTYEDSFYYHPYSGIDFHKPFYIFTQMITCTDWYVFNSNKIYTTSHGNPEWCAVHKHHIYHKSYKLV